MNTDTESTTGKGAAAMFSDREARILASLMEKELTVPASYPLSLHSLTLACNQKSNREPQMQLSEGEVGNLARALAERGMINIEYGDRVHKFEHNLRKMLHIDRRQQALLTVMMLRAPQTLNEFKIRTKRMAEFSDLDDILLTLESLNERDQPIMLHIPRGPGQREDRYTHLLCGEIDLSRPATPAFEPPVEKHRLAELELKVNALEARIAKIEALLEVN